MPFVKLDCGILDSTLWSKQAELRVFLAALLMAVPLEIFKDTPQLEVDAIKETGFMVPPGWYGFVPAAGEGILRRAGISERRGLPILHLLGSPEQESRSNAFNGRRLVRIDGGYLVLNYMRYRDRDYTAAERQRRMRARRRHLKQNVTRDITTVTRNTRDVTREVTHSREQIADLKDLSLDHFSPFSPPPFLPATAPPARARAVTITATPNGFDAFWALYPRKVAKAAALKAWTALTPSDALQAQIRDAVTAHAQNPRWQEEAGRFIPHPSTWLRGERWLDVAGGPAVAPRVCLHHHHPPCADDAACTARYLREQEEGRHE